MTLRMKLFIFSFHVNEIFSTYFQHKIRKRKKCLWTSLVVTVRQTSGTENWNNNIRTAPNRKRLLENGTEQRTKCFEDYRLVGNFKTWISMEKPFQNNNKKMVKEEPFGEEPFGIWKTKNFLFYICFCCPSSNY